MKCSTCQEDKADVEFAFRNKATGLRHGKCRQCMKAYCAAHYQDNADAYKRRGKINGARRREELHRRLFAYLAAHSCVDCGESDPLVLELDHRDAAMKEHNLSKMWGNGYSWLKILREVEKCDVRCANCHRRRTARQQNWSILDYYTLP